MKKYELVHIELHIGGEDYDIGLEGFYIEAMINWSFPIFREHEY